MRRPQHREEGVNEDANKGRPLPITEAFEDLVFLARRTPGMAQEDMRDAFARLADYRDGAIFIGHYAGNSEWERHGAGDEIVVVIEGETTLFILDGDGEVAHCLSAGRLIVVPRGAWHRFETPRGVKILSVTPPPTEHRVAHPAA